MKRLIKIDKTTPLTGVIQFGIIDRGTNLIQIRATSICNLNCPYCSTDGGLYSKTRVNDYIVEREHLVNWVKKIVDFKGENIEAHLDSVGENLSYPEFIELVNDISKIKNISFISMQTNGTLLNEENIRKLEKAGMNRINLSINSLNEESAKRLSGCEWYDIKKIIEIAKLIRESKVELLLTPVWIPKINDKDIIELIKFAKELKCGIGIQKYEIHKYGRKIKSSKDIGWWKFYNQLGKWEKEFEIKLKYGPRDMKIERRKSLPKILKKGEVIDLKIKIPGWMKDQMIGIFRDRCVNVVDCNAKEGDLIKVKILENKNNLYLAKQLRRG